MSDIFTIIRRLDLKPARKITSAEADIATPPLTKYQKLVGNVRHIQKIPVRFYIEEKIYRTDEIAQFKYIPRLLATWQFTLPQDFYILTKGIPVTWFGIPVTFATFVCISFRVGLITYRYWAEGEIGETWIFNGKQTLIAALAFPKYINQKIGKNFTFELWARKHEPSPDFCGYSPSVHWESSLLVNPVDGDQTEILIKGNGPIDIETRAINLPQPIGFSFPYTQFLDNPTFKQ